MGTLDSISHRDLPVVLLIDDDLVSREVSATLLTLSGYTVHSAVSGEEALEKLAQGECVPGAILCDVQMPGLNGLELIARLRSACRGVPVYVFSGTQPPGEIVAAANGVLLKPFDADALWKLFQREPAQRQESFLKSEDPIVSVEVLNKLRQMMSEKAIRQIYAAMVMDLDRRIEQLGSAIAKHDRPEVKRIGHAIKGGCGMAGAMQAARIGALLEAESIDQDNQLDNSRALLADLRSVAEGLHRILEDELPA